MKCIAGKNVRLHFVFPPLDVKDVKEVNIRTFVYTSKLMRTLLTTNWKNLTRWVQNTHLSVTPLQIQVTVIAQLDN